ERRRPGAARWSVLSGSRSGGQQYRGDSNQQKGGQFHHRVHAETGYHGHAYSTQSAQPSGCRISRRRLPIFLCSFIVISLKHIFSDSIVTILPYASNPSISNNSGIARYRSRETGLNNLFG